MALPAAPCDCATELQSIRVIVRAAQFAAERHAFQKRKGAAAEPYINHLLEVADLVSSALDRPDPNLVVAALLHDAIEDVGVTRADIESRFGRDVADLVFEVTDDKTLPKAERKRLQVANAPYKSARAQVIKLADKISNLRALLASPPPDWTLQRRREYAEWARQVVNALSRPNPMLKAEFDAAYEQLKSAGIAG